MLVRHAFSLVAYVRAYIMPKKASVTITRFKEKARNLGREYAIKVHPLEHPSSFFVFCDRKY